MNRVLLLLIAGAAAAWCQAEGQYRYASLTVKAGVSFQAVVRSGAVAVGKQAGARFTMAHPVAPGQSLAVAASPSGSVLAGSPASSSGSSPELFVALRAPAPGKTPVLAAGDWSAVMISLEAGTPRGLRTSFLDFSVSADGAIGNGAAVSHEAAVDDVSRAEATEVKVGESGTLVLLGLKHSMALAAAGDMFLATSSSPAHPSLVIAVRRDRDATTMAVRGAYALAEIGARNSFSFAPEQARFFAAMGTLEAVDGLARVSQRVILPDSATEFRGLAAYMLTGGGAGTFSPRLEQRRRNLAVSGDGSVLLFAQVAEPGRLSLLHGIGIGVRVVETAPPVLAATGTAQDNVVSLYGQRLQGVQVRVSGQPAAIAHAWSNQIDVKLAAAPVSPLSVEIDWQGGRMAPVSVSLSAAPPEFAVAPSAAGGLVAPTQAAAPGETIELGVTGAMPPAGFALLFDGIPGQVVS